MKPHRLDSSASEAALIREAKNGSEQAFTQLVRDYEGVLFSFAFKVCRDKEKAAETVQDTFINVYHKLKQFDGRSKFTTWLYAIVTNNCLMKRRKTKLDEAAISIHDYESTEQEAPHEALVQKKDTPLERVVTAELRQHLDEAIKKLGVDYRVVFVLRDIEGLRAEEVAKILKISVPAVKSRLRRARIFLQSEMQPYVRERV
jgi:RNA polymerase sigma-70 factor (ECF subfamily)